MPKPATIFKAVYLLGLAAQIAIRQPYDRQRRRQQIVVDQAGAREQGLIGLLFLGILGVPLLYIATPSIERADYRWDGKPRVWAGGAGTLVLIASLWLFYRAHADLGANWSPSLQVRQDHALVTTGVYQHLRHPMYASELLWSLAQPLLLQNWVAGWAGLGFFVPFYLLRVPHEEHMMRRQFGARYDAYVRRSGGILPRLGASQHD